MNLFQPLAPVALFFSCLLAFPFQAGAQNAPVALKAIPHTTVPKSGGTTTVNLSGVFGLANLNGMLPGVPGPIVRFEFYFGPYFRFMDVQLLPEVAPATVANFRAYMAAPSRRYDGTLVHRSIPGFVIQGGGYALFEVQDPEDPDATMTVVDHIATFPTVKNEFQRPNLQGTIAMAKLGADDDSLNLDTATSEWFINIDNNFELDAPNQKFTVFGSIIGTGFETALIINQDNGFDFDDPDPDPDAILPWDLTGFAEVDEDGNPLNPNDPFLAFGNIPLIGYDGMTLFPDFFFEAHTVREIPFIPSTGTTGGYLTLSVTSSNTSLVKATVSGTSLTLKSVGSGTGTATITVKAVDAYGQQTQKTFNVMVVNPALPLVSIAARDNIASEPTTDKGIFRITRTGSTTKALTVKLSASGSTAMNGTDYNSISATLIIPAKAAYKDITITPRDDKSKEGTETVKFSIASNSAYNVSPTSGSASIALRDNEVPNVTVTSTTPKAFEPSTKGVFLFSRSGSTNSALSIPFTVSGSATLGSALGSDYTLSTSGTAVIPAGFNGVYVDVHPVADMFLEGIEIVTVTAKASTSYNVVTPSATVTIFDNACPTVTVSANLATASEAGTKTGQFKFSRTGATTAPLTVYFTLNGTATNGTDYTLSPSSSVAITILAGSTFTYLTVKPKNDTTKEAAETVQVTLKPTIYYNATPGTARVTINDND